MLSQQRRDCIALEYEDVPPVMTDLVSDRSNYRIDERRTKTNNFILECQYTVLYMFEPLCIHTSRHRAV